MARIARQSVLVLWAACSACLAGCFGGSQNPSYFPYLFPSEDIVRTHAKPPGHAYFADFDPHARSLVVRPLEATNPVQSLHVLIATVYDEKGQPRRNRRVEWMLEGVGHIVEVDESGILPGRGYKVDNKYAVSYTDYKEHRVTRGNANPNDDFVIRPGQTWCVISAAVEGDSHVTVYAPEIADWDHNRVVVTKHWVDAEWVLPPPGVGRAGTQHAFVTNVFRHTDRKPLTNYRVRYRVLDGPPALFVPSQTQEAVAISDLSGNAGVTLAQATPQPGINRIGIEIVRPPDPCSPSGAGIIIGQGEVTMEWQAPVIGVTVTGPPSAAVNGEAPFTIAVANTGKVEMQAITVHSTVPDGLDFIRSDPPAVRDGKQLVWTLGALPSGQQHAIQATYRATRVGAVTNCATATTPEGLRAEHCATIQVTAPQIKMTLTGPDAGVVGVPVPLQIAVTNPGSGPASNVVLSASFDASLEHESKANPVEMRLGTLDPNETRVVPLALTPRQTGKLNAHVTATADGNLRDQAQHVVTVQQAQLTLTNTGPAKGYVDSTAVFNLRLANPGDVPLSNVIVRDALPPELGFVSANEGGLAPDGRVVTWNIGQLGAHQERSLQVTTRCLQLSPRAVAVATATADPSLQVKAEAGIEINGVAALQLTLSDTDDPIQVGGRTTYKIVVTSTGTLPSREILITAIVPPQMRLINASGPTKPTLGQPGAAGQTISFPGVDSLAPKQALNYSVEVEALQAGDNRFHVELRSATLGKEPVTKEESTTVYASPPKPAAPAPTPAPTPNPPASSANPG